MCEVAYLDSISSRTSGDLCILQLSMTTTEFGPGHGCMWSNRSLMNAVNRAVLKDPSTIVQSSMPVIVIAGKTEYLAEAIRSGSQLLRGSTAPPAACKDRFPTRLTALQSPRLLSQEGASVACTLIDENKLFRLILTCHS